MFMRELADRCGGVYREFNNLCMVAYPVKDGSVREVFATLIKKPGGGVVAFTSLVGEVSASTDFKGLLDFSHHQCYSKVTVSGDKICVSAVTGQMLTSQAQLAEMVHEVASASAQLASLLLTQN